MANITNTGITFSSTDGLTTGQKIMIAQAKMAFEPAAPDPDLVSNERIPSGTKQWDILTYARLAVATQLQEAVDLSNTQQLYANTLSVNPVEHGVIVTLSKRAMTRQPESLERLAGTQMGVSVRARMALDILALYSGFSNTAGAAGTTIDLTHVRRGLSFLLTDNDTEFGPAPMPVRGALHAEHIGDLIADLTDAGTRTGGIEAGLSADLVGRWWRGNDRAYGAQFFHSGYMTRDAGLDAIGKLAADEALHLVMETNAEPTRQSDESARITEFGLFQSWSEAERAGPHGIGMTFDASAALT